MPPRVQARTPLSCFRAVSRSFPRVSSGRFLKHKCREGRLRNVLGRGQIRPPRKERSMLYAILAYHVEAEVMSWTKEADAAVMTDLLEVHDRLNEKKLLGPAARLGGTAKARTLRGPGAGVVIDGPFAET